MTDLDAPITPPTAMEKKDMVVEVEETEQEKEEPSLLLEWNHRQKYTVTLESSLSVGTTTTGGTNATEHFSNEKELKKKKAPRARSRRWGIGRIRKMDESSEDSSVSNASNSKNGPKLEEFEDGKNGCESSSNDSSSTESDIEVVDSNDDDLSYSSKTFDCHDEKAKMISAGTDQDTKNVKSQNVTGGFLTRFKLGVAKMNNRSEEANTSSRSLIQDDALVDKTGVEGPTDNCDDNNDNESDDERQRLAVSTPISLDDAQTQQPSRSAPTTRLGNLNLSRFHLRSKKPQDQEANSSLRSLVQDDSLINQEHGKPATEHGSYSDQDNNCTNDNERLDDETNRSPSRGFLTSSNSTEQPQDQPSPIKLVNKLEGHGGGDEVNCDKDKTGNGFVGFIQALQRRHLQAKSEFNPTGLTAEEIDNLKRGVEESDNTRSLQSMKISGEALEEKSGGKKTWKESIKSLASAAFAPEEYVDHLIEPDNGEDNMGFYSNVPLGDEDDFVEDSDLHEKRMKSMNIVCEGEGGEMTFLETITDGEDMEQCAPIVEGGYYATLDSIKYEESNESGDSDGSNDLAKLSKENCRLVAEVKALQADLQSSNNENKILREKVTTLQRRLASDCGVGSPTKSLLDRESEEDSDSDLLNLNDDDESNHIQNILTPHDSIKHIE